MIRQSLQPYEKSEKKMQLWNFILPQMKRPNVRQLSEEQDVSKRDRKVPDTEASTVFKDIVLKFLFDESLDNAVLFVID